MSSKNKINNSNSGLKSTKGASVFQNDYQLLPYSNSSKKLFYKRSSSMTEFFNTKFLTDTNNKLNVHQRLTVNTLSTINKKSTIRKNRFDLNNSEIRTAGKIVTLQLLKNSWRKKCMEFNDMKTKFDEITNEKTILEKSINKLKIDQQNEQNHYLYMAKNYESLRNQYQTVQKTLDEQLNENKRLEQENLELKNLLKPQIGEETHLHEENDLMTKGQMLMSTCSEIFCKINKQVEKSNETVKEDLNDLEEYTDLVQNNLQLSINNYKITKFNAKNIMRMRYFENKLRFDMSSDNLLSSNFEEIGDILNECNVIKNEIKKPQDKLIQFMDLTSSIIIIGSLLCILYDVIK